ncbi:unnamed protein product [Clonostachys chloroleuca]|uniref:Zn(2)-C6 fungal-type domain-containing protein n=1 Tax=Clonostachys chloroleuca TaxID=1926264 RepID=A0AA35M6U7_9HYPO|nr:unnamed protein product [Clonostachys chloroleuca]CAI6082546.1 unnamed protein product [Clonostachys chloroleuca]CAI6091159.1 unnamed protein product [Clonostachys chloroleuca]
MHKCTGDIPCKRCKDGGLICTASVRRTVYKHVPQGYAEILESTQLSLVATIHKLYSMVRNDQQWGFGEPESNDCGEPVIHSIAQKLGCIRPSNNINLPVSPLFPEDEAGMAELANQLEVNWEQEPQQEDNDTNSSVYNQTKHTSSSAIDRPDFELNHHNYTFENWSDMDLTVQNFAYCHGLGFTTPYNEMDATALFSSQSPSMSGFPAWNMIKPQPHDISMQFLQQADVLEIMDLPDQGLVESEIDAINTDIFYCPNPSS